MAMTPEQRRRARDVFEAALERDPAVVAQWVLAEVPDDSIVLAEVQSLLNYHSHAGAFLTQPLVEVAPHLLDESHALQPGAVVGAYTVVRELGRGGMGRVYLASDSRLGRSVALKALPPEATRDPRHRERLRREARAAAQLTHPGICTVYALEEIDDDLYIATEYLEGHTLREEVISGARPPLDSVIDTARQLASALAGAHAKGVIHRDLKPENVMRTRDGSVKILDFGLARVENPAAGMGLTLAMPGTVAGTPAYMAPEQIDGRTVGPAADVFAFGVLMYEWITGRHPFQAGTQLAMLARVMESSPEPIIARVEVPPWLSDLVDRCLRKPVSDRFASALELVAALENPGAPAAHSGSRSVWWRTHQVVAIGLYVIASTHAWHVKEWIRGPVTLWVFLLIGIAGSVAGIVRGHLVFTDAMNRPHLPSELRRTHRVRLVSDLMVSALLVADALLLAGTEPLIAVLTTALAAGIALASVLMEPATTAVLLER